MKTGIKWRVFGYEDGVPTDHTFFTRLMYWVTNFGDLMVWEGTRRAVTLDFFLTLEGNEISLIEKAPGVAMTRLDVPYLR